MKYKVFCYFETRISTFEKIYNGELKKRILYIAPHRPGRSPGQRFRFEQFISYLNEQDFSITYSYLINRWDDRYFYARGYYLYKLWIVVKAFLIRMFDVLRAFRYDMVIIYREAHFLGTVFFEKLIALSNTPMVFDFDDAIWLNDVSNGNQNLGWLKRPSKTGKIIKRSDLVIAGNEYLASYARRFSPKVSVIPTTIDTDVYLPQTLNKNQSVCIGWIGSLTTLKHFQYAIPFLVRIKEKYGQQVSFKVIVDQEFSIPELDIITTAWRKESEITDLNQIDIGIMPLPDDEWSKGKCGFKGIQYMALEKPTIMSPVGVNTEIIQDGVNGFLAETQQEWIEKLSRLIESSDLRRTIGKEARKTILERYSVNSQKKRFIVLFNEITRSGK